MRPYAAGDEPGWVRCRALAFLETQYYDDVKPSRTIFEHPAIQLVAVSEDGFVCGILDVEIDGDAATIDTVAVHPDHSRRGIATAMLDAAVAQLRAHRVTSLDAWTREDRAANTWYRSRGFLETYRYLHVYKDNGEPSAGFSTPEGLSGPRSAFMHADISQESWVREQFARVYVCRQYLRRL